MPWTSSIGAQLLTSVLIVGGWWSPLKAAAQPADASGTEARADSDAALSADGSHLRPHHPVHSMHPSPAFAFALDLTPLPVAFGNFYAGNLPWAIGYTAVQLALAGSMVWLGARHMCHDHDCSDWTTSDTMAMAGLASGYIAVKLIAAFHAGATVAQDRKASTGSTAYITATPQAIALGWRGAL